MTRKGKLYAAGLFYVLWLVLIVLLCLTDRQAIGPEGTVVGLGTLNTWAMQLTGVAESGVRMEWYQLTEYLGYFSLLVAACFALFGFVQLLRRRSLRKVDRQLLAMGGLFIVTAILYVFFEKIIINCRPFILTGESGPEASFPSSHTMLTCVILGSVSMVLKKYVKPPVLRSLLRAVCVLLILAMVFGRLICGCHWFTDILGGVLVSLALLTLFGAVIDGEANGNQNS